MSQFLHVDDDDVAKAIAIPPVFSERLWVRSLAATEDQSL